MNFKKYTTWGLAINLMLITSTAMAQTYKSASWSTNIYVGGSNMLGDLGGSRFIGNRGIFDYNIRANRLALGTGITMNSGAFSVGLNALGTRLVSNDGYSRQNFQVARNLSVRTNLFEVSVLGEIRPFSRSAGFNRFYIYTGVGGIYYKPMSKLKDEWYDLRKAGTEGQYLDNGPGPYSELDIVIPCGLGYKFRLAKSTSLLLDVGFRKTFTDYLDDVSTVYADPALLNIAQPNIPVSQLADKSLISNDIGSPRGNPLCNDSYVIIGLKFEYILGGKSGDGCYYNRNPPKTRSTRINQRKMFTR
jgi:hypothetical protein